MIKGIKYPFQFSKGSVAKSAGDDHIIQNVMLLIGTGKGESIMRPDFGSNVQRRVFDPINTAHLLAHDITSVVTKYARNVRLNRVKVDDSQGHGGVLQFTVDVSIKGNDQPASFDMEIGV